MGKKDTASDDYIKLLKHGGSGGECHKWFVAEDDWVVQIEYSFDWFSGAVQRIRLFTYLGEQRSIGYTNGIFVAANYSYDHYKQFVGFLSYEVDDASKAFGSYDSFCNHLTNDKFSVAEIDSTTVVISSEETIAIIAEFSELEAFEATGKVTEETAHFEAFNEFHEEHGVEVESELTEAEAHFKAFSEYQKLND